MIYNEEIKVSVNKNIKVFLGGTCNDDPWRKELIPMLQCDYFNPVVDDWTPECRQIEEKEKLICTYHLYVITKNQTGFFSIAEVIDDSNKIPWRTILCVLDDGMDEGFRRSLKAVEDMAERNNANVFHSLDDVAFFLNNANRVI